jgi:hypothetical protein
MKHEDTPQRNVVKVFTSFDAEMQENCNFVKDYVLGMILPFVQNGHLFLKLNPDVRHFVSKVEKEMSFIIYDVASVNLITSEEIERFHSCAYLLQIAIEKSFKFISLQDVLGADLSLFKYNTNQIKGFQYLFSNFYQRA